MKSLFPNAPLPKHKPLHVVLKAPDVKTGSRTLFFPELGKVDDAWVANEYVKPSSSTLISSYGVLFNMVSCRFFLAYFSGKGISPAVCSVHSAQFTRRRLTGLIR